MMYRMQQMASRRGLVSLALVFALLLPASGSGLPTAHLIRQATGNQQELPGATTDGDGKTRPEGAGGQDTTRLSGVLGTLQTWAIGAGFAIIPIGVAFGSIMWALGSPRGPRYILSVAGAGLALGCTGIIVA